MWAQFGVLIFAVGDISGYRNGICKRFRMEQLMPPYPKSVLVSFFGKGKIVASSNVTLCAKDAQGENSLKVEVGKAKGDPVVMGLLKSTMFPLQQVLEGIFCACEL